jgi:hypothetical protein
MTGEKQKQEILSHLDRDFLETVDKFFDDATQSRNLNQFKEKQYRVVNQTEAAKIKEKTGLDIEGYKHKITNIDIRHIYKEHGNPKTEIKRGQIAVTRDDIKLIPEITQNYDLVKHDARNIKFSENKTVLIYKKKIGNEYYYLETVGGKGNKDLRPKTMYIKISG